MRIALAFSLLLMTSPLWAEPPAPPPSASAAPEEELARGKQAYARGNYALTIQTIRPLLYPEALLAGQEELTAHKLLALSYFFERNVDLAEEEFTALLQLKEDFVLDPLFDPTTAVQFLERIRRQNQVKLEEIADKKKREEAARQREEELRRREEAERACRNAKPAIVERHVERHYYALNFVPFGVGQMQNGQPRKAWAFFSTELILGAASVALWATLYFGYAGRALPQDEKRIADGLNYGQVILGGLFWLDVAIGIIDAMVHYRPSKITTVTTPASAIRPRVSPFAVTGGGGLFLRGAF